MDRMISSSHLHPAVLYTANPRLETYQDVAVAVAVAGRFSVQYEWTSKPSLP